MVSPTSEPHPLDGAIRAQNALLEAGGVALRLERRGQRLGLRGPLPCRQGSGRHPVQRISLGLAADAAGLEQACSSLRRVQQQLQLNCFDWSQWAVVAGGTTGGASRGRGTGRSASPTALQASLEGALQRFEHHFHADPRRRRNPAGSRTTWSAAYLPYLRRLRRLAGQQGLALGPALLVQVLQLPMLLPLSLPLLLLLLPPMIHFMILCGFFHDTYYDTSS